MAKRLEGKNGIVTGGSRGIGFAITRRLAAEGASVVICARNAEAAERAASEIARETGAKVFGTATDVSKQNEVEMLFEFADEKLGQLHILVNNAGVGVFGSVAELTPEEWDRVIGTNLNGAFYCTHAAIPRIRNSGGGSIVNISSLAAKNVFAGGAAYNASKFGLKALTEATMLDHRYDNIRVSDIMPGSVNTEFGSSSTTGEWKIAPEDVAEVATLILTAPERTLISRVEMRPSRPVK
jgi:NAD(P)-dependent dehydrogenase (short-subunit alcohol dehydrogenase family)